MKREGEGAAFTDAGQPGDGVPLEIRVCHPLPLGSM